MKAELKIKNFRTLKSVKVDMRPTMFLLGPNGAGKSTFIKSLIFLSKNLNSNNEGIIYNFPDSKIDLRSFENIVSDGDISKEIEFEFNFEDEFNALDYIETFGGGGGRTG